MGKRFLIDTNVIIDFAENKLTVEADSFIASVIDSEPIFSIINKIELLSTSVTNDGIKELLSNATIVGLTDEIVLKTIELRKKHKIKLPDAIIAATAINKSLCLLTHNLKDFANIKGLNIVDPWQQ